MSQPSKQTGGVATARACRLALGVGPLLVVLGLADPAAAADPADVPAVIVEASARSRSELAHVIRDAMHGVPVTLADDALTASNMLSLQHANPRDDGGRPFNGRELSRPETFELFKRGSRCVLVQSRTGRAWTLHHVRCAAMTKTHPAPDSAG